MAYSNWKGLQQFAYCVHDPTGKIVKVARFASDNVSFIDSFGIPESYNYGNYSRNQLAKKGWFPKTKAGNEALEKAISELPSELKI